jgi:hypothetical protein
VEFREGHIKSSKSNWFFGEIGRRKKYNGNNLRCHFFKLGVIVFSVEAINAYLVLEALVLFSLSS